MDKVLTAILALAALISTSIAYLGLSLASVEVSLSDLFNVTSTAQAVALAVALGMSIMQLPITLGAIALVVVDKHYDK